MKKRILISVSSDLSTDQRVLKVAKTCYENGFEVLLIGRKLYDSQSLTLPYPVKRFHLLFNKSIAFYAELNIRLFFLLLFSRTDIFLSNDTDTLPANFMAAKFRRKKLVFDAHELFPEVPELADRPLVKKVWTKIEDSIFPKLQYSYTVCRSIADYYNKKYNIDMKVVRNLPYYYEAEKTKLPENKPKVIIYQGALNMGRGLEWVIDAMPFIENAVLLIIGDGDIKTQLEEQVAQKKLDNKVTFKAKMRPEELYLQTSKADIGLCLLENKGLSYYYSLPNRIFDYIHADIPVLASRFPEITTIVETYKTGILIDHYEPEYLAKIINDMLEYPYPTAHFTEIAKKLCWENEEKVLISVITGKL
ncbi:MAG: glycosyltransferase [Bacteroidales bacterium]|nr:glycosyltransferase [Bacteroidales bacterium]